MMGGVKADYECIKAFSETDFTEDLKWIDVPVLVIHSEDDQIVPYADSAPLSAKLLKNGTLKIYKDLPHGCRDASRDRSMPDLLAFVRGEKIEVRKRGRAVPERRTGSGRMKQRRPRAGAARRPFEREKMS